MVTKKNCLIYVVEDNAMYNRVVSEYLKRNKYNNVVSFFSGKECLESLKSKKYPDIILQDYSLSDMTGIDVLRRVKKVSPRTEFIFLTANESTEVAVNTIKYGAYDYIIKDDVALEKVVNKIHKISILQELKDKNEQIRLYKMGFIAILVMVVLFSFLHFVLNVFNLQ